jgi:heat-inducible transcriptional repressor
VIHQYIKTGKPVGSAFIAAQRQLDLSPATIRNIMSELEREGFLSHPHTSAGRVPTDKAYRFYVDSLVELQRLAHAEAERIQRDSETRIREIEDLLLSTSKTLSALSHYTGFVTTPDMDQARLQHVELVPLDPRRLLAVLVSDTGVVKHRVVMFDQPYRRDDVPGLARLLHERLQGQPFAHARERLLDYIESAHQRQMDLLDLARRVSQQAFDLDDGRELFVEGAGNMLALPEFREEADLRGLGHLLDEKKTLGDLIARDLAEARPASKLSGVRVKIGSENTSPGLQNVSLVTSAYTVNGRTVGVLGILGPKRMEYSRMISLVNHVAEMVSRSMNRMLEGE